MSRKTTYNPKKYSTYLTYDYSGNPHHKTVLYGIFFDKAKDTEWEITINGKTIIEHRLPVLVQEEIKNKYGNESIKKLENEINKGKRQLRISETEKVFIKITDLKKENQIRVKISGNSLDENSENLEKIRKLLSKHNIRDTSCTFDKKAF